MSDNGRRTHPESLNPWLLHDPINIDLGIVACVSGTSAAIVVGFGRRGKLADCQGTCNSSRSLIFKRTRRKLLYRQGRGAFFGHQVQKVCLRGKKVLRVPE